MAEPRLVEWLKSGGRFYCIGWSKRGKAGKKKVWTPKIVQFFEAEGKALAIFLPVEHPDTCMCIDCIPSPNDKDGDE